MHLDTVRPIWPLRLIVLLLPALYLGLPGCSLEQNTESGTKQVIVDGSSTVYPISSAVMEEFQKTRRDVIVPVAYSGTGAGFQKFSQGELDVTGASRPIKADEIAECERNGVEFVELTVAIDGLTVVAHPENSWCNSLTVEQLREIYREGSSVSKWSDINPAWPQETIVLLGADSASGTYDYFKEAILGKDLSFRVYENSANDNELVEGVSNSRYALGYFGYAYYVENRNRLKAIAVAEGDAPAVLPTPETIENGTYSPLSRRLYIYVNKNSLRRGEVRDFVRFYLSDEGVAQVSRVGYVQLPLAEQEASRQALAEALGE